MLGTLKRLANGVGGSPSCERPIDTFYGWTIVSRQEADVIVELLPRWYRAFAPLSETRVLFLLLMMDKEREVRE